MSKQLRKYSNSQIYHIILKGIDDENIFYDNIDRNVFLERIQLTKKLFEYEVYAYCLMSNHVHMVIKIKDEFLSKAMQNLIIRYVSYFNKKYNRKGPFVQSRFKSKNIEDSRYFIDVCRYIHRNPEKAKIENTAKYKWSSFHEYIGKEKIITKKFLMHYFNNDIEEFIKFTTKKETLYEAINLADFELNNKLSDEELIYIIEKKYNLNSIQEIIGYFKNKENQVKIKELKKIKGTNKNQLSRIIRINKRTLDKILNIE